MKLLIGFFLTLNSFAAFLPKSFDAKFVDVRGKKEIPVNIKYKYPKQIFYEVKGDTPLLYVCNQKKTWKYSPPFIEGEKGELAVGDSGQFCYSRIFDSLSKGLSDNKLYKTSKNGTKAVLSFTKKAVDQLGLEKIEISFSEDLKEETSLSDAKSLKLYLENKAEPVLLKLVSIDVNPKLDSKIFKFEAPKNTKTIQMK
ncbi:MAG: hypothetical protein CME64_13920 [Halobacteriovoraceae bacterium]|nr:hypothetical protein [Halobacteriovoraceae bacterium]|tara:strand:- start:5825 stop:6418 length:594 start_codon:yes stop_codon:yes gene_type:complete